MSALYNYSKNFLFDHLFTFNYNLQFSFLKLNIRNFLFFFIFFKNLFNQGRGKLKKIKKVGNSKNI